MIQNYTRNYAFECRVPKVKAINEYDIIKVKERITIYDPFKAKLIPSISVLQVWQGELEKILRMTTTIHVIDCELGYLDLKTIKDSRSFLKANDVKEVVRREIDWFNQPALIPNLMVTKLSTVSLNCFKSMLLHNEHSKMFDRINMSPNELASICCKRYLSGDQMIWITNKLNSMQSDVHCININYIRNIKRYVQRINSTDFTPTILAFIVNVEK